MRYLRAVLGWTILASVCGIAWMYSVPSARTQTVVNGSDSNWHDNIAAAITAIGQQDIRIGTLETNTAGLNATNTSQQATNATFATTYATLTARVAALEAKVGTTPPVNPPPTGTSANGSTCAVGQTCSLTDAAGAVWTLGAAVDGRGSAILKNGAITLGVAASLLYCSPTIYGKTGSGTYWQGPGFSASVGVIPPCQ